VTGFGYDLAMKTLEEILAPLADKTYDELKPVAIKIGLSVDTLYKITKGYTRRPSFEHVRKIAGYVERKKYSPALANDPPA